MKKIILLKPDRIFLDQQISDQGLSNHFSSFKYLPEQLEWHFNLYQMISGPRNSRKTFLAPFIGLLEFEKQFGNYEIRKQRAQKHSK